MSPLFVYRGFKFAAGSHDIDIQKEYYTIFSAFDSKFYGWLQIVDWKNLRLIYGARWRKYCQPILAIFWDDFLIFRLRSFPTVPCKCWLLLVIMRNPLVDDLLEWKSYLIPFVYNNLLQSELSTSTADFFIFNFGISLNRLFVYPQNN